MLVSFDGGFLLDVDVGQVLGSLGYENPIEGTKSRLDVKLEAGAAAFVLSGPIFDAEAERQVMVAWRCRSRSSFVRSGRASQDVSTEQGQLVKC